MSSGHGLKLKPQLLRIILMGIFCFTGFNALFYAAAHHTTAVNISIIQGSQPILVLIGSAILFFIAIHWQQTVGIVLTMIGIAIIALKGELSTLHAVFQYRRCLDAYRKHLLWRLCSGVTRQTGCAGAGFLHGTDDDCSYFIRASRGLRNGDRHRHLADASRMGPLP